MPDYVREVLPRLTAELVYGDWEWSERKERKFGWRSRSCPSCGEGSSLPGRFSLDPESLWFKCHSCERKGSPVDWFMLRGGLSLPAAFRECERLAGLAPDAEVPALKPKPKAAVSAPSVDPLPARLWGSVAQAEGSPTALYLERRRAWPLALGWRVPVDVGWLLGSAIRETGRAFPDEAGGAIAFAYRSLPGEGVRALKLEALDWQGARLPKRWRRAVGRSAGLGLRFHAQAAGGGFLHVCEGELTALALAVQARAQGGSGTVIAVGGTSGLRVDSCRDIEARPVYVHADGDVPGRRAVRRLRQALRESGRTCEAVGLDVPASGGSDALDSLAALVEERLGIAEGASGRAAWEQVIAELRRERLCL